jgi:hypothetical protein
MAVGQAAGYRRRVSSAWAAGAAGAATLLGALTSCSTAPVASNTPTWGAQPAGPVTQAAPVAVPLPCATPSEALVQRGSDVLAAHPGPVTATTLVPAAVTDTGQWYVLGIDRAYATDDGTLAGGSSRGLAVTDADADPDHAVVIPLTHGPRRSSRAARWTRVTWTGDILARGKSAAARAFACLDEQR